MAAAAAARRRSASRVSAPAYTPRAVAIFASDARTILKRLADRSYETSQERDELLAQLATAAGLRARDLAWMLFRPDRSYRDAALPLLRKLADPETVDLVLAECHAKPEAAVRSAAATLFAHRRPRHRAAAGGAASVSARARRRRSCDACCSRRPSRRRSSRCCGSSPSTGRSTSGWPSSAGWRAAARRQGARRAGRSWRATPRRRSARRRSPCWPSATPQGSVDLFVEQMPLVGYSTQQLLVEALTRAAAGQGAAFADRLLPLMASGEPATRSAVLKILLGIPDRARGRAPLHRLLEDARRLGARPRARLACASSAPTCSSRRSRCSRTRTTRCARRRCWSPSRSRTPRIVPATIGLLKDPDWWIRITRRRDARPAEGPARRRAARRGARRPRGALERGRGARPDRRPAGGAARSRSCSRTPRRRCASRCCRRSRTSSTRRCSTSCATSRSRTPRAPCARARSTSRAEMAARSHAAMADEDALRQAALAAKVGAGEPQAARAARRHAQQRRLRLPPLGRPAADAAARLRPGARAGRAVHGRADARHDARDPERGAVGEARARAPARLLPLHPDRRPLPRERLPRPERDRTPSSA